MNTFRNPVTVRHALIAFALAAVSLDAHAARGADDIEPLDPVPPNASLTIPEMTATVIIEVKFNNGYLPGRVELRESDETLLGRNDNGRPESNKNFSRRVRGRRR